MPYAAMKAGWTRHPKVLQLPLGDRWIWLCVIDYSVEYGLNGYLPPREVWASLGLTQKLVDRMLALPLLDEEKDGLRLHNWDRDNGTGLKRAQWRERQRKHRDDARMNGEAQ
jgi:hypothetical protein